MLRSVFTYSSPQLFIGFEQDAAGFELHQLGKWRERGDIPCSELGKECGHRPIAVRIKPMV
jgi:hypothetical protein